MRKTFARRLADIIDNQPNYFAKKCGVPVHDLRNYLEERATPSADNAAKIASAAGVNLQWLVSGEGEKYLPSARERTAAEPPPPDRTVH